MPGRARRRRISFMPRLQHPRRRLRRSTKRCCRCRCARSRATGCCRSISRFRSAIASSSWPASRRAIKRATGGEIELVLLFGRGEPALRERRRRVELRAVLHAGDQSLPQARGPHSRRPTTRTNFTSCPIARGRWTSRSTRSPTWSATAAGRQRAAVPAALHAPSVVEPSAEQPAYFTTRREPRLPSSTQKRRGPRSSYIGTEVFLSLVDPADAPFRGDLRQLSIQTLCTNRDLVLQMPMGRRRHRLHARHRGAGQERSRGERPEPAAMRRSPTAPCRGAPSIICR